MAVESKLMNDDQLRLEPASGLAALRVAIAATFTAEPVEEALAFWMEEIGQPGSIEFAPYNQVFQQLLDPNSLLGRNRQGINVVLLRLEDWQRFQEGANNQRDLESMLQEPNVRVLATRMQAYLDQALASEPTEPGDRLSPILAKH